MRCLPIAVNTFRKSIRKKVLLLFLILSAIIIASSHLFSFFTVEEELKIILDVSMASIALFGMITAIFISSGEIPSEIERKTIHSILAKPVQRHQFIIGKFLGVVLVVMLNILFMTVILLVIIYLKRFPFNPAIFKGIYFIFLELALIAAAAIFFSSFSTAVITISLSILVYLLGHLTEYLHYLYIQAQGVLIKSLFRTIYFILPNLENFNIRNQVVHNEPITVTLMLKTTLYCIEYITIFLLLTILFFQRREI